MCEDNSIGIGTKTSVLYQVKRYSISWNGLVTRRSVSQSVDIPVHLIIKLPTWHLKMQYVDHVKVRTDGILENVRTVSTLSACKT